MANRQTVVCAHEQDGGWGRALRPQVPVGPHVEMVDCCVKCQKRSAPKVTFRDLLHPLRSDTFSVTELSSSGDCAQVKAL